MRFSTTSALVAVTIALCLGFASGWWYRDLDSPVKKPAKEVAIQQSSQYLTAPDFQPPPASRTAPAKQVISEEQIFDQMLAVHRFGEATVYYDEAVSFDPTNASRLRPVFDQFLQSCFQHCDNGTFLSLVDAWMATYYDDIPVLLTLAEFQQQRGEPEASAGTLLMARTYAIHTGERQAINLALSKLSQDTDERLAAEERWIELLGFYEFLAAIDFTTPSFELRRAGLYRVMGEQERARALLASLFAADDGGDPQWTAELERHRSETSSETTPSVALSNAIPLERRGNSYLVEVTLNDQTNLKLLVDTGASMTALTRNSFRRLHRPDLSLQGTRLFSTANGYTRGDVYRAAALTLGYERVEGVNIAVLDFRTMEDIDGLLGMNVLRQFGFEIDQVAEVMHLNRR